MIFIIFENIFYFWLKESVIYVKVNIDVEFIIVLNI